MNREFLKNLGIADDLIDKIMGEHGKDVQAEKDKTTKATSDNADLKKQLDTYKAQVSELERKAGDNADVSKQLKELQDKIAEEKRLADEKAADEQLTATIKGALPQDKKFVNEYTEAALISQIKAEMGKTENRGKGVGEILTALTKDKAGIFANPNQPGNMGGFGGADIDDVNDSTMRAIMGLAPKETSKE